MHVHFRYQTPSLDRRKQPVPSGPGFVSLTYLSTVPLIEPSQDKIITMSGELLVISNDKNDLTKTFRCEVSRSAVLRES
jgi:hypothetical protein